MGALRALQRSHRRSALQIDRGHEVTEIRVVRWARLREVGAGKEVAVTELDGDPFVEIPNAGEVQFRAHKIIRLASRGIQGADHRDTVVSVPGIVGVRQKEGMEVELGAEIFGGIDADADLRVVEVLPGEEIHVPVEAMIGREEVLERPNLPIVRIVIARGEIVFRPNSRLPHGVKIVSEAGMHGKGAQGEVAHLAVLVGAFDFPFETVFFLRFAPQAAAECSKAGVLRIRDIAQRARGRQITLRVGIVRIGLA